MYPKPLRITLSCLVCRPTFFGRVGLQCPDVGVVACPGVHPSVGLPSLLRQLLPMLRLRQQLADGALGQTEDVPCEQALADVVSAEDLADALGHVRRVQRLDAAPEAVGFRCRARRGRRQETVVVAFDGGGESQVA